MGIEANWDYLEMSKHRDSFYQAEPSSFQKAWEYFKDVVRPGNVKQKVYVVIVQNDFNEHKIFKTQAGADKYASQFLSRFVDVIEMDLENE